MGINPGHHAGDFKNLVFTWCCLWSKKRTRLGGETLCPPSFACESLVRIEPWLVR
uniref:Uncharacterized protein n=1 Tax=Arundo donax TaxID=35708 RepID=A0A0A9D0R3_ARUDO